LAEIGSRSAVISQVNGAPSFIKVCFVRASQQNVFFEELGEALRSALERHGIETETAVDHFPRLRPELVYVFIPHEYFPLTDVEAHPSAAQLRRTVVLATEQPGTPWFAESLASAQRAGATIDIHLLGFEELKRLGVHARYLPLGYVPEWDAWGGKDNPRPIDVTFLGGYTERRALALARCGGLLSRYRASLRLVDTAPHTAQDRFFLSGARKFEHFAASKIVISAHRAANSYLEWQRLLGAAANGCVVLTEHSSGYAPLLPGEHFVSVSFDNLPVALAGLLEDEAALERIRTAAYDFIRAEMPLSKSVRVLVEAVEEVGGHAVEQPAEGVRVPKPAPKPRPQRLPEWERIEVDEPNDLRVINASIKSLTLRQSRLERELSRLRAGDQSDKLDVSRFGPEFGVPARVTVVLTVFNSAATLSEAIASVALAANDETELIVVDDASTDDSAELVARILCDDAPWLRATLLKRAQNGGLPAARNLAIEHGKGDYIFILDADNGVYPHAFSRLREALDADDDAAFAYGILEKFDGRGSFDLTSWVPWQPEQLKYGNRIDAMAMLRRAAFERVGGYLTDERLHGWEDFALWCAFAQEKMTAVLVPEIVGRYRSTSSSMIALTMLDTTEAWAVLRQHFPFLDDGVGIQV
jgi:hypothetical protein